MDVRALIRWIFSPMIIIGAIIVALMLFFAVFMIVWIYRPQTTSSSSATAILHIIPYATLTPVKPTNTPTIDASSDQSALPSPLPGDIIFGSFVQISGTGGAGLRLRQEPNLEGEVRFLALESEVFIVEDGPKHNNDYSWWYLVAPYDETVRGWAVSNFLLVVQNP